MSEIGFVILSHSDPEQLLQLTKRLGSMFPDAKINCAHDFGQSKLDPETFPSSVSFIRPHERTAGGMSPSSMLPCVPCATYMRRKIPIGLYC